MNDLSKPPLSASRYDRSACQIGVVHLGLGAFHRAHQAVYLDRYMAQTGDLNWGVAAVNLRAEDAPAFQAAAAQAEGYVLKTMAPDGDAAYQLIRAHVAFRDWSADAADAEALLSLPSVRAVTITVTEGGYALDDAGALDADNALIQAERTGGAPRTVYAYLARALKRRAATINQPITILCCDNIRANGRMLQRNLLAYLRLCGDEALADWVARNATFPCSMVDRITPRASEGLAAEVSRLFPLHDRSPVHGETFIQWVLEDRFAGPFPDLAKAGVEVVKDVHPFEEAKIRILNGGHTGLAYLGALAGWKTFDQAMADPRLRAHFDRFHAEDVLPALTLDLPFDKAAYAREIANRFCNASIADQLERICMDGFAKMPIFIRPTLEARLAAGAAPRRTYDSIASWVVFARRAAAGAAATPYHEPNWDILAPLIAPGRERDFARSAQLWADLADKYPSFAADLTAAINEMEATWPA